MRVWARRFQRRLSMAVRSVSSVASLALLAAVTLAILNPLLCLAHCALLDQRTNQHGHQAAASDQALFVCDMRHPSPAPLAESPAHARQPMPATSMLPRAVYESIAPASGLILPIWLLIASLAPLVAIASTRRAAPPLPPPRAA